MISESVNSLIFCWFSVLNILLAVACHQTGCSETLYSVNPLPRLTRCHVSPLSFPFARLPCCWACAPFPRALWAHTKKRPHLLSSKLLRFGQSLGCSFLIPPKMPCPPRPHLPKTTCKNSCHIPSPLTPALLFSPPKGALGVPCSF